MRVGGTLAVCDKCGKGLNPFEKRIIKEYWVEPGKRYAEVSSDVSYRSRKIIDLCEECKNKLHILLKENGFKED